MIARQNGIQLIRTTGALPCVVDADPPLGPP